jgi:hydrogenase nickel incorporation protein HypA/HybF
VLKIVLKYAAENQAARVVGIRLQVGELRDLTEEWIQRYFDYLSRDTLAEGATISLTRIPVRMACLACRTSFSADLHADQINCPACGHDQSSLTGGDEFLIESIEVI